MARNWEDVKVELGIDTTPWQDALAVSMLVLEPDDPRELGQVPCPSNHGFEFGVMGDGYSCPDCRAQL